MLSKTPIYLLANIVSAAIPFLLLPVLTRELSPGEYGIVAMFAITINVFSSITGLSLHGSVKVRYFELSQNELNKYISTCIFILVFTTIFLLVVVFLSNEWLAKVLGVPGNWVAVAVLVSSLLFLINLQLSLWQVSGRSWSYGFLQVSRTLADGLISILLIIGFSLSLEGRLLGQSSAIIFFGLLSLFWLHRSGAVKSFSNVGTKKTRLYAKDALTYGLPLVPHVIGGLLVIATDRVIIANLLGKESVGLYMVAFQISQIIAVLTDAFNKAYSPWLFNQLSKNNLAKDKLIVKATYLYFISIISVALLVGLLSPKVLPYIVGKEYLSASHLIIYFSLGFAFGGCYFMVVNYLFFHKKTKSMASTTFVMGLFNIPLTYYCVSSYGLEGGAVAFMVIKFLNFLFIWIVSHRMHPMPWFQVFK